MKTYYFKDHNQAEFSVRANDVVEATKLADDIAAKSTGRCGLFGMAFFKGYHDEEDGDTYLSGSSASLNVSNSSDYYEQFYAADE